METAMVVEGKIGQNAIIQQSIRNRQIGDPAGNMKAVKEEYYLDALFC